MMEPKKFKLSGILTKLQTMEARKNDQDNNQDHDYISNMPDEVLLKIGTLSGATGFYNLVRTSKQMSCLCLVIKDPLIHEDNLDVIGESTRAALAALYDYVKPVPEHKTGLVFDANIYVEALKLYEEKLSRSRNWHQRSFWCMRVEEHLASLLGTGYLRPHAQGVDNIDNKLKRSGCILADGSSYFALRRPSNSVPGSYRFVASYGRALPSTGVPRKHRQDLVAGAYQELCRAKTRARTKFMRQYSHPSKSTCLVC